MAAKVDRVRRSSLSLGGIERSSRISCQACQSVSTAAHEVASGGPTREDEVIVNALRIMIECLPGGLQYTELRAGMSMSYDGEGRVYHEENILPAA